MGGRGSTRNARGATRSHRSLPGDPDALDPIVASCDVGTGRGRVGVSPTSPQLSVGRVAQVTDETSGHDEPSDERGLTDDLDAEQLDAVAEAQRAMEAARERLKEVPAEVVVTNHVMGLYELGAIHLSSSPPDLVQAALAIDAVACLVDGLGDRLGDDAPTLREALNNIRVAFVQIKAAHADATGSAAASGETDGG